MQEEEEGRKEGVPNFPKCLKNTLFPGTRAYVFFALLISPPPPRRHLKRRAGDFDIFPSLFRFKLVRLLFFNPHARGLLCLFPSLCVQTHIDTWLRGTRVYVWSGLHFSLTARLEFSDKQKRGLRDALVLVYRATPGYQLSSLFRIIIL